MERSRPLRRCEVVGEDKAQDKELRKELGSAKFKHVRRNEAVPRMIPAIWYLVQTACVCTLLP